MRKNKWKVNNDNLFFLKSDNSRILNGLLILMLSNIKWLSIKEYFYMDIKWNDYIEISAKVAARKVSSLFHAR